MATEPIVQPYSVDRYNQLPSLHSASTTFKALDGEEVVQQVLGKVIQKYEVASLLGVGLLHCHFDLHGSEKMVELNNISMPWDHSGDGEGATGGKILASSWMIVKHGLVPYEFFFSPLGRDDEVDFEAPRMRAFVEEFVVKAEERGVDKVICLRRFPHVGYEGGIEITQGRANIMLKLDQISPEKADDSINTMWFFEPRWLKGHFRCKCTRLTRRHIHRGLLN